MKKRCSGTPRAVLEECAAEIVANCPMPYLKNNRYKVEAQSEPGKYYDVCFLEYRSLHPSASCHAARRLQAHYCSTDAGDGAESPVARRFYHKPAPKRANEKCGSANCKFCEPRPRKSGGASGRHK